MIRPYSIPIWKEAPFTRLLLPLVAGIILQWYLQFSHFIIIAALICYAVVYFIFRQLPLALRFKLLPLQGFIIQLLIIATGCWLTWQKDLRNHCNWYGNHYTDSSYLVVHIDEPLVEKNKTYKADGLVEALVQDGKTIAAEGKLILYFSKDSIENSLKYGDRILIHGNLSEINNSGNPGAFNYKRYAAFQGIFHNAFLKEKDWELLQQNTGNPFRQFIFTARAYVLDALRTSMKSDKDELGIAEALLIGYTNDLDKDLVQAYSNTGVVHIIAISGMHLALIYLLLVWVFAKIPGVKKSKWLQLFLILGCLWMFSFLTGASASVLRAAVMFSFIAIGKNLYKEASIYNSLAGSAFFLLCYDPYFLWAVGFQLSYLAVLSIVIFQKPVYNSVYVKNKWLNKVWQLLSVSVAAQVLTFPVCIYYFHQFPNLFLISNMIAVPLSGVILYAEIILTAFSWLPYVGTYAGKLIAALVWLMNKTILWINSLSFAVWDGIPATVFSTVLMYISVACFGAWLLLKQKKYFKTALAALLVFIIQNTFNSWLALKQQKLVVYNVPRYQAIDFIQGNQYRFVGDSVLKQDGILQNFHLKPGRISQHLTDRTDSLPVVFNQGVFYQFKSKRILIADHRLSFETSDPKMGLDLIVLSKNPDIRIGQLLSTFNCEVIVFDASNPAWKIEKWKKECSDLHLTCYSVAESGAFIYDIGI